MQHTLKGLSQATVPRAKYDFADLNPGDAKFITPDNHAARQAAYNYAFAHGFKYSVRKVKAGVQLGDFTTPEAGIVVFRIS